MPELVSILIPAYNAELWLGATIRSVLAQTWPATEVIIVDDGSRDGTLAVARAFESRSVKVVHQENMGAAAARNAALALAQGTYIQWLDADDLLAPQKIASQMRMAMRRADPRILLSSPWASFMYRPSAAKFFPTPLWEDLEPREWICRKWAHNVHMQTATWLVSRHLTTAAGPWNTELLGDDDGEYFTRVVLASRAIAFVPDAGVFYRIVGTGRLSYIGASERKLRAHLRSMELQIEHVRSSADDHQVRAAIVHYLQTWLHAFYPENPDLVKRMERLAAEVGGRLLPPPVSAKYALIDQTFGRVAAKRAQDRYNAGKTLVKRSLDRILCAVVGP